MKQTAFIKILFSILIFIPALSFAKDSKKYEKAILLNFVSSTSDTGTIAWTNPNGVGGYNTYLINKKNKNFYFLIQLNDIVYIGESIKKNKFQHDPSSDFVVGDPINVFIDKEWIFLQRPNGKSYKIKIVRKERVSYGPQSKN